MPCTPAAQGYSAQSLAQALIVVHVHHAAILADHVDRELLAFDELGRVPGSFFVLNIDQLTAIGDAPVHQAILLDIADTEIGTDDVFAEVVDGAGGLAVVVPVPPFVAVVVVFPRHGHAGLFEEVLIDARHDDIELEGDGLDLARLETDMIGDADQFTALLAGEGRATSLEVGGEVGGNFMERAQLQIEEQHDVAPFTCGDEDGHAAVEVGNRFKNDADIRVLVGPCVEKAVHKLTAHPGAPLVEEAQGDSFRGRGSGISLIRCRRHTSRQRCSRRQATRNFQKIASACSARHRSFLLRLCVESTEMGYVPFSSSLQVLRDGGGPPVTRTRYPCQ